MISCFRERVEPIMISDFTKGENNVSWRFSPSEMPNLKQSLSSSATSSLNRLRECFGTFLDFYRQWNLISLWTKALHCFLVG